MVPKTVVCKGCFCFHANVFPIFLRAARKRSFLPSFLRSRHSASSCVQESRRKRIKRRPIANAWISAKGEDERKASEPKSRGHKIRSLVWGGGQSHIKNSVVSPFFPAYGRIPSAFFFFCLYHLSKGHSSRSVESARPDSPPPTHPAAECLRSASLRSQNPARQSHPAFPANKKNTSLRGHLHLPGGR